MSGTGAEEDHDDPTKFTAQEFIGPVMESITRHSRSPRGETWTFYGTTDHFPYDDEGSFNSVFHLVSESSSADITFYDRMRRTHSQC
jgi:hypothetical protein